MAKQKEKSPRVFVLQKQSRYDVSAVDAYSKDIIYIADRETISPFDTFGLIELIEHKLIIENFRPAIDYICLTGPSVLLAIFLATFVSLFHYQSLRTLMFDARHNKYTIRMLEF